MAQDPTQRLPDKPETVSEEDWKRLSAAYYSDGVVAAFVDAWRQRRFSFETMLLRLALEQTKRVAAR